jgi:hypothetical protein
MHVEPAELISLWRVLTLYKIEWGLGQQSCYPLLFRSLSRRRYWCNCNLGSCSSASMSAMLPFSGLSADHGLLRARAGSSLPCCSLPRFSQPLRHAQLEKSSSRALPLGLRPCWQFPQSSTTAPRQQQQQPRQQVSTAALPFVVEAAQAVPQWDVLCGVAAAVCSLAWVKIFDRLKKAGVLEQVRGNQH